MATEQVVEQVAEGLEEAAEVTRKLNVDFVGGFSAGLAVGFGIGLFFGYRWNKEKLRAEAYKQADERADEEIEQIRESLKVRYETAKAAVPPKPSAEQVVEERGYSTPPPQGVLAPERPTKPPIPVQPEQTVPYDPPERHNLFAGTDKHQDDGWDYATERARRSGKTPYILHQDEFNANETGYHQVTYTFYAGDFILVDENNDVVTKPDLIVGQENLRKWGHGSDDFNTVFIRNPKIEMEFEICRSPKSYAEDVLGLNGHENDDPSAA